MTFKQVSILYDDQDESYIDLVKELRREFSAWSTISYAISILGILGSVPATLGAPLAAGGPATAVWCWALGSLMALAIGSSVAELVSAYPTAGGMYFVAKYVVPPPQVPLFAWMQGWSNLLGQTAGVASVTYTVSQMVLAGVSMNYSYSPTPVHTVVLAIFLLILLGLVCSRSTKTLHRIVFWFAPINILASLVICLVLLRSPNQQPFTWVFTHFTDGSGYGSKLFSFLLGFISVAWTMTDYDGTTHMSEETHDAATLGPRAIQTAVIISGFLGWILTVCLCRHLTDFDAIMNSSTGLPAAQIFLNVAGPSVGSLMWAMAILVQSFTACSAMLADTRMVYAFARDEALPFSEILSEINTQTLTPVNSVIFVVIFSILLTTIALASTKTATTIFSITAPALDLSYVAVILAHRLYRHRVPFVAGPFTLGKWTPVVNWVSVFWVLFISTVLFFPPSVPVTWENMNYGFGVGSGIALFAWLWWRVDANGKYTGPRTADFQSIPQSDYDPLE
ncbi:amino acid permease [Aspergillus tanneri]|uniref:Amino acid transporter n=1 Tax=Aspergillus tanneri TaxID=1220188 RepID=A0A5M9MGI5_9EURO|nr:uncharacterized protein ATNIH1004_007501 [Aspergillus tanneri]KAA8646078.1 hypothetical protein ATNIH1004_007501 [Aspergillus tanneri]